MYVLAFLAFPLCWAIFSRFVWHKEITWIETISISVITSLLTLTMYFAGSYSNMMDTATINGEVVSKTRDKVGCRHSYSCNCRMQCSGSGKNRSCYTYCDTCYEHSYDVDWNVHANVGGARISTIDRQGLKEPPRWTQVKIGDPYTRTERYTNYIKAAPNSLFSKHVADKYEGKIPEYPQFVYDYYKMGRAVSYEVNAPLEQWNTALSNILKQLGPQKQANVVILFAKEKNQTYADAVAYKWLGGKKNDIVVIVGTPSYPEIEWVRVLTWSKSSLFQVKLRDALIEQKTLDAAATTEIIKQTTLKYYQRKEFKEFSYLENEIEPPEWVIWASFIIALLSAGILTFLFHRNDEKKKEYCFRTIRL